MKKILAILLCACMLLPTFAMAEAAAPAPTAYRLSNMYAAVLGDTPVTVDLTKLALELDVNPEGGLRLHIDKDGAPAVEFRYETTPDGLMVYHMNGEIVGHKDFAIDPVTFLDNVLQKGIAAVVEILQGVDTNALAKSIISFTSGAEAADEAVAEMEAADEIAEPEEPVEEEPAEEPEETTEVEAAGQMFALKPSAEALSMIQSVVEVCVSDPETVEMGGNQTGLDGSNIVIPDGTYTKNAMHIDTEHFMKVLDKLFVNEDPDGPALSAALADKGVDLTMDVNVELYDGDAGAFGDVGFSVGANGNTVSYTFSFVQNAGDNSVYCKVAYAQNETNGTAVQFMFSAGEAEADAFGETLDMANVVMLNDPDDEESYAAFTQAFADLGFDALGTVIEPLGDALMAGVDLSELEAELAELDAAE